MSQAKELFIITGGIYGSKTIGQNHIAVPDYCYKVVMNVKTKDVIYCLLFANDESNLVNSVSYEELKEKMGYKINEELRMQNAEGNNQ